MADPAQTLKDFKREKEFFIGIDSDGCAFDTMELKHKECFIPAFIKNFNLQSVSKYARESWNFVNLYSKTRGSNRFLGVKKSLDLLNNRKEVKAREAKIPELKYFREWINKESKLGNPSLIEEIKKTPNTDLDDILKWSLEVNKLVIEMVKNCPPFPYVEKSLIKLTEKADALVISQAPYETLKREWSENKIDGYVKLMAGQEMGTKTEHIKYAAIGKYDIEKILMIGDSPGDYKAAKNNGVLFYPINPGHEEDSWERFYKEALERFFSGNYAGKYEETLVTEFNTYLPENPNW